LSLFFAEVKLTEIGADEIRAYQRMRMARAGPVTINHECSILQQLLKCIGRWEEIKADYSPMRLSKESVGRAITDREEELFFRYAFSRPSWEVAAWTALVGSIPRRGRANFAPCD
jgi:hypothetical protein